MPPTNRPHLPAWLLQLRTRPESESGIHWYTETEVRSLRDNARQGDEHLKLYDQMAMEYEGNPEEEAAELLQQAIPVGVAVKNGPFTARRRSLGMTFDFPAEFWFDPASPDTLLCSLNATCPPHFWFPVGQSLPSISAALGIYFGDRPSEPAESAAAYAARLRQPPAPYDVPDGWTTRRMLLGVIDDMRVIENGLMWRTGFCRPFESLATGPNSDRRVAAAVFHTVHSYSRVSLEWHQWLEYAIGDGETGNPVVVDLTYPPADHAELIRRYNQRFDVGFPLDVPVDVVAALFGYPTKDLARLHAAIGMNDTPGGITYVMGLLAATEGDDAVFMERLQEYSTHPEPSVRAKVARYASIRQHPELIHQMIDVEKDHELRDYLEGLVLPLADE